MHRSPKPGEWRLGLAAFLLLTANVGAAEPVRALDLRAGTHHVQGIDTDGSKLWVSSVDPAARKGLLFEFALNDGRLLRQVEVGQGVRFHPGGISTDATSIWVPVAEYRRSSSSVIEQRSKRTLELQFQFPVPDHIGCLAVAEDRLIGGNWDSRKFYIWNRQGKLLRELPSPVETAYQDWKFDGHYLVGSGVLPDHSGAIDWLQFPSLRPAGRVRMGKTDHGAPYTREGMAILGDRLLLLPEDGKSRLFFFHLPELKKNRRLIR